MAEKIIAKAVKLENPDADFETLKDLMAKAKPDDEVPYLGPETYVRLYQKGPTVEGVKWGVAWANGDDSTARKWVVAVDTAAGKVYVETGPTGPVDWNVVEVKLGMSGNKSEYTDPILGGEVVATIDGLQSYAQFR
ncbi:uncharacterized protein LOC110710647 [Chenopodium quinoa]|uniref:uncharacterized protein LOC110710647 n=1 Tax=Chenopodium quinoa TaxID=63459 RepID=UPI000B77FC92|nr:uncharacterized protein LOC110710647 [Chenopodium quinoa]